jgi:hypothetical protein
MEHYSTLNKSEILPFATILVNLEDILLSETNQSQNDQYYPIPLTQSIYNRPTCRSREYDMGWGWSKWKVV